MSRRNSRSSNIGVELKLNLSPQRGGRGIRGGGGGGGRQAEEDSPDTSPARSCVSSEDSVKYSSSPETTSMVVVGCPRCLMYVMLSDVDPRCPKCKSTVLLDFHPTIRHRVDDDDEEGGGAVN
ncbi:hypothetical protein V2J09_006919 [Rumex salicifolius]